MIHTTIGVYANGDRKTNGVPSEDLAVHIWYNLKMRPGRAFFLDGICLNNGYLNQEEVDRLEKEFKDRPIRMDKDTAPYV
jgi:hypothetical protein